MNNISSRVFESFKGQLDNAAPGTYLPQWKQPTPYFVASVAVAIVMFYLRALSTLSSSKMTYLNRPGFFELSDDRAKRTFLADARKMMQGWFAKNPKTPVKMYTDTGPVTVLPAYMANEIRNDKRFLFREHIARNFHAHLPGFEAFGRSSDDKVASTVITRDLTKQLTKVTEPLAEETSLALADLLTDEKEWHQVTLRDNVLRLVARISSRVFLGTELCRNEDWLRITREYTVAGFEAAHELHLWPWIMRPVLVFVFQKCRNLRHLVKESRRIIGPIVAKRRELAAEAIAKGEKPFTHNDAIDWFEETTGGSGYDPDVVQLGLSLAAIHTTTDLISKTITDILAHPEIIEPLRNEIIDVLQDGGWQKTSLYKMKLLDSVIKESQRTKPISMVSMARRAAATVTVSDGTVIKKGDSICVTSNKMWDSDVHDNADEWDGYRFFKMREQPDKQNLAQLVTTGPDHLAFGHGMHACPGRFFAANEVKIVIIALMLKYDMEFPDGKAPAAFDYGFNITMNPVAKVNVRRRKEEVSI